jgi:hypothetical protein
MIRSITQQKPEEEVDQLLEGLGRIFIIGCGTCVTLTNTGGEPEVAAMKQRMSAKGKLITGHVVLPVACDNMTKEALQDYGQQIDQSDVLLIMTCAFGVQTIARQYAPNAVPASWVKPAVSVRLPPAIRDLSTGPVGVPIMANAR